MLNLLCCSPQLHLHCCSHMLHQPRLNFSKFPPFWTDTSKESIHLKMQEIASNTIQLSNEIKFGGQKMCRGAHMHIHIPAPAPTLSAQLMPRSVSYTSMLLNSSLKLPFPNPPHPPTSAFADNAPAPSETAPAPSPAADIADATIGWGGSAWQIRWMISMNTVGRSPRGLVKIWRRMP
jgi:hypothetical protein